MKQYLDVKPQPERVETQLLKKPLIAQLRWHKTSTQSLAWWTFH
jgi:hypothetical protein